MFLTQRKLLGIFAFNRKLFVVLLAFSLTVCYFALVVLDGDARVSKAKEEYESTNKDKNVLRLISEVKMLKANVVQLTKSLNSRLQSELKNLRMANIADNKNSCCNNPAVTTSEQTLSNTKRTVRLHLTTQLGLNAHIWHGNCFKTLEDLCRFPIFPGAPDKREIVRSFDITRPLHDFSQRLFGFLHPPESGRYIFALASDDSSELWLSRDEDWKNSKLIASVGDKDKTTSVVKNEFSRFPNQKSSPIFLEKERRYFIEALHIEAGGQNFLQVAWQGPGIISLESLKPQYLLTYFVDDCLKIPKYFELKTPKSISCRNIEPISKRNPYFVVKQKPVYLEHKEFEKVLPTCTSYDPSYIVRGRKLKKHEAVHQMIYYTSVYPLPEYQQVIYEPLVSDNPELSQRGWDVLGTTGERPTRRTIQGKLSYTPILTRMNCDFNAGAPKGFWEVYGFGLVGIYKSDWDKFGGFNIHKEGWGGEDYDIIDRIVEISMETERLRTPYVLHLHHSKTGMWKF